MSGMKNLIYFSYTEGSQMDNTASPIAYVGVNARFEPDGRLFPLYITWEDGKRYKIDRLLDVRRAACLKGGGTGIRYTVRIGRFVTHLFFDEGRWFVERKD